MATWTRRETVTRTVTYSVPCGPGGACYVEVNQAMASAAREYRQLHGIPDGDELADDAVRYHCVDDEILIRFEVPEVQHANR